jgi:hypothetical protein
VTRSLELELLSVGIGFPACLDTSISTSLSMARIIAIPKPDILNWHPALEHINSSTRKYKY